jgi:BCD family chlorophyll transporter-like MFS transporter
LRDLVTQLASSGALGPALTGPATGYGAVYHLEILVLFAALVAIGPLVRQPGAQPILQPTLHLAEFPG